MALGSDGLPDSEKIPIGFDAMMWAEICSCLKDEIKRLKKRKVCPTNTLFDLTRALKRIDGVMSGAQEADYGIKDDAS